MNLNLDKEVENIINNNGFKISREIIESLTNKYDSRIVATITNMINKKHTDLISKAQKYYNKIQLSGNAKSLKKLNSYLQDNKAKYMKKLGLNDNNYKTFVSLVTKQFRNNTYEDILPYNKNIKSEFKKIFGENYTIDNKSLYIDESEKPITNSILALYKNTHNLYNHVFLQSVSYTDMSEDIMMAKYDSHKNDVYEAISPVIVALYLPKFEIFEKYTLNSNLARVIYNRYNNTNSDKDYDENLVQAILSDPNETICTNKSKMEDILKRCKVQVALWNTVLSLRNGRCYQEKINEDLLKAVDNCNANDFDTPEFLHFGSEDMLLKKLLATFSFRPILTHSIPLTQLLYKPFNINNRTEQSSMQMLTYRLNNSINNITNNHDLKNLFSTNGTIQNMNNIQYSYQHNSIVPKQEFIENIREMLIIHVSRKRYNINRNKFIEPLYMKATPKNISGTEDFDETVVNYDDILEVNNKYYTLRSVVCTNVEKIQLNNLTHINLGSYCYLSDKDKKQYIYDPYTVNRKTIDASTSSIKYNNPYSTINSDELETHKLKASKYGTLFIYQDLTYLTE